MASHTTPATRRPPMGRSPRRRLRDGDHTGRLRPSASEVTGRSRGRAVPPGFGQRCHPSNGNVAAAGHTVGSTWFRHTNGTALWHFWWGRITTDGRPSPGYDGDVPNLAFPRPRP